MVLYFYDDCTKCMVTLPLNNDAGRLKHETLTKSLQLLHDARTRPLDVDEIVKDVNEIVKDVSLNNQDASCHPTSDPCRNIWESCPCLRSDCQDRWARHWLKSTFPNNTSLCFWQLIRNESRDFSVTWRHWWQIMKEGYARVWSNYSPHLGLRQVHNPLSKNYKRLSIFHPSWP